MYHVGIILASIALVASAQSCTQFVCGTIDNNGRNGTNSICGQQASNGTYIIDHTACNEGFECELQDHKFYETKVENVPPIAFCIPGNTTIFNFFRSILFGNGDETRYPGDVCDRDSQCYGQGVCKEGVCEAANPNVGASCPNRNSANCAAGQFCNQGTKRCEMSFGVGKRCTYTYQCPYASVCYTNPNQLKTCVAPFSISNGKEIIPTGNNVIDNFICQSGNFIKVGTKYFCMPGITSVSTNINPQPPTASCYYKIFNNTNDPSSPITITEPATCGFGDQNMAYCDQHLGDAFYTNFIKIVQPLLAGTINCHEHSDSIWDGADCKALIDILGKKYQDILFEFEYLINYDMDTHSSFKTSWV
jgi:hypothetical protein